MANPYLENSEIRSIQNQIEGLKGKRFSDIEDENKYQYIDLVQEGGGVLGIALVGYTYVLEQAGIRFFSLAGTSAGAINTMLVAGLGNIGEAVSEKLLNLLSQKDLFDFVDGDPRIKDILQHIIDKKSGVKWKLLWNARRIYGILKTNKGINPGLDFEQWLQQILDNEGVPDLKSLNNKRKVLPKGLRSLAEPLEKTTVARLAVISSDISTNTKAEFPRMAGLYWSNPDDIAPAKFVRASMSIPFFFYPFTVDKLPDAGSKHHKKWIEMASYYGDVPAKALFVDGGMLSNFPINVFHRPDGGVPRRPTFGVRLSTYRQEPNKADSLLGISGAMISTMRQIHDYDFILKNPDFSKLICNIDADQEFNWLNFNMTEERKVQLFLLGARKALKFLQDFDWEGYKDLRKNLSELK